VKEPLDENQTECHEIEIKRKEMKNQTMNAILHHIKDDDKPTWENKKILRQYFPV
jgi:hypothetical protein